MHEKEDFEQAVRGDSVNRAVFGAVYGAPQRRRSQMQNSWKEALWIH